MLDAEAAARSFTLLAVLPSICIVAMSANDPLRNRTVHRSSRNNVDLCGGRALNNPSLAFGRGVRPVRTSRLPSSRKTVSINASSEVIFGFRV